MKTLLLLNPQSNLLRNIRNQRAFLKFIKESLHWLEFDYTYKRPSEINFDIYEKIVITSGDGGFTDFLQAVPNLEDKLICHLPAGTGKDIARSLGMEHMHTAVKCCKEALLGNSKYIAQADIGEATIHADGETKDMKFFGTVGVGIDGLVVKNLSTKFKHMFGKISYNLATLKALVGYKPETYWVMLNDSNRNVSYSNTFSINVSNVRYTGGGIDILPKADWQDGYLDALIVHSMSKSKGVNVLKKANKGEHTEMENVEYLDSQTKIKKVQIECSGETEFHFHMSGEYQFANKLVLQLTGIKTRMAYNPT